MHSVLINKKRVEKMSGIWTIVAAALSFAMSGVLGIWLVPYLRKKHFGQTILEEGPKWHQGKQGTPTMGGFMFIAARGMSKTWLTALFCVVRCILYPGSKIVVCSGTLK